MFSPVPPKEIHKLRAKHELDVKHPFGCDVISEVVICVEATVLTSTSERTGTLSHFSLHRGNMIHS